MSGIKLTYAILEVLASFQGIVVGSYLLFKSTRKRPTFFLGLFLFLFALEILPSALRDFNIWNKWQGFQWLPLKNIWLLSPIFLVYTLQVSVFKHKNKFNWLFIPGLLLLVIRVLIDFLPQDIFGIENFIEKYDYNSFLIGHFFCLFVGVFNLKFLQKHIKTVNQYFSSLYMKELKWARTFIYFGLCLCLASLVLLTTANHFSPIRLPLLLALIFTVYWLSFYGSKQLNIHKILNEPENFGLIFKPQSKKNKEKDESPELGKLMVQLQHYFKTNKPYTNPDITLVNVAVQLKVHPKKLSKALNLYGGTNFNRFVNKYRVDIAKTNLLDPKFENLSIEGIGRDVGFASKSAFYGAFKLFTGTTPLEYKRSRTEKTV